MEDEKYIQELLEQYKAATGEENIDLKSSTFISSFYEWVIKRQIAGDNFLKLLEEAAIDIDRPSCAEIGKGKYDSIVTPYDTTIITPYYHSFKNGKKPGEGGIISSEFNVIGGVPTLTSKDTAIPEIKVIAPSEIQMFMTHNPYSSENLNRWVQIHSNINYGIIFGVYGNINDKDRNEKIKLLNKLKYLLFDSYTTNIETTIGDKYYNITATDMLMKKKMRKK